MNNLRVLIIEDKIDWQEQIARKLQQIATFGVDYAKDFAQALNYLRHESYDLVSLDLGLPGDDFVSAGVRLPADVLLRETSSGLRLLEMMRQEGSRNATSAVIVISGHSNNQHTTEAVGRFKVNHQHVFDKNDEPLAQEDFLPRVGQAVLFSRLKRARLKADNHFRVTTKYGRDKVLDSQLYGPSRQIIPYDAIEHSFDAEDLVRRADLLNWMISNGGADIWRPEARSIGKAIYETITAHRHVLSNLTAAKAIMTSSNDVWLEFTGPAMALGVPFELMRDEHDEPLALYHIMTRQITGKSRKAEPFHEFVRNLLKRRERLNILIVGANSDSKIPAAEAEANALRNSIGVALKSLGIDHHITLLCGHEASYDNVRKTLSAYECHIFHYAGHGRYDDKNPEKSGLVLRDGNSIRILPATELDDLVRNKNLRMVYLSSCTSARTAERAGQGDFYSIFDALAKADVPVVIGFRWAVADAPAMEFARAFYDELWRTFSPGEALMKARKNAANGPLGRDDDTWLSPILMMHST